MAKQQKYFIGPSLLSDIRKTITRVDAIAPTTSGAAMPVRLQDLQRPPFRLQRGSFTGSWAVNATKIVTVSGSTNTISVTNYCTPVFGTTSTSQSYDVVFGPVMGTPTAVEVEQPWPIRVGKVSVDWAVGTCATVSVWERRLAGSCKPIEGRDDGGTGEYSGVPPVLEETIEGVANLSHDVASGSWVVVGQAANGRWYLLDAGKEESSCRQTIGGEDVTKWPGWNGSIVQLLGHDENGCLKWFDSEECEETSPGTP